MRQSITLFTAAAITTAAVLLSACSSAPQSNALGLPPTGVAGSSRAGTVFPNVHHAYLGQVRTLYVDDFSIYTGDVDAFRYRTWQKLGMITDGIDEPVMNWVDKSGNLYVTNSFVPSVTEYDPSGNLLFTYKNGLSSPDDVTTDQDGNVYVVNEDGTIVEDRQQIDSPLITCNTGSGAQTYIAQNKGGDLFASLFYGNKIVEYRHGLFASNCVYTALPIYFGTPTGMAVDRSNNLVVCDSGAGTRTPTVDIIAPPYTSISGTLGSGWGFPWSVRIDKPGTQADVVDWGIPGVRIVGYPGGSTFATLTGLGQPEGAVDSKNYVP